MFESFAILLSVGFGMVIGAVWQSLQDWRMAEAERREREHAERVRRWPQAVYPPVCVRTDAQEITLAQGYPMQKEAKWDE